MRKFSFTQKDVKNRLLNCRRGKRAITNEGKILRKKERYYYKKNNWGRFLERGRERVMERGRESKKG